MNRAPVLVGAGLREDLDSAVAEFVVLGREGVLIDANFTDRLLRGKLAAAEAIDEDGAAAGTCRGTGESREVGRQIVGIVRERVEIGALQDHRAGIVGRVETDRRSAIL